MKKIILLCICLFCLQTKQYASSANLQHYNASGLPPGYTTSNFSVCGSVLKDFKLYYGYCTGPSSCGPANLCIGNANYRFLVTLQKDGNWVADHTFQASNPWTYDYFYGISVTAGTYRMKIDFQKSNLLCQWVTVNTTYSNSIVVSTFPTTPVLSMAGTNTPCHTGGYPYSVVGNTTGTGNYTWTSTNPTFRINGLPFPLTTTSSSVVINATVPGATTTLSVTLSGVTTVYCGVFNVPTKVVTSISSAMSVSGPGCIAPHTTGFLNASPAGSSGYNWQYSSDNITWGSSLSQTTSTLQWLFQAPGTYYFRVRNYFSGCTSDWAYMSTFCTTDVTICRTGYRNTDDNASEMDISIYPNPSDNEFNIEGADFGSDFNLVVYDLLGKIVEEISGLHASNDKISFGSQLQNGIYNVVLYNEDVKIARRIIKAE